jgi:hypothetical protein
MTGTETAPPTRPLVVRVAKATAAVVAFIGSALGVIFVLWPQLKPEPPSPTRRVALSELRLEQPVTFGAYLRRVHRDAGGLEDAVLKERGALVTFHFAIEGYKNRRLPIVSQLINARSGNVINENRDTWMQPEVTKDSGNWPVWVPLPRGHPRRVFVEVEFYEPRAVVPLRTLRTKTFTID